MYPNLGNFLLVLLGQYPGSTSIVLEAVNAFRNMTRKMNYLPNLNSGGLHILFRLMSMNQHLQVHPKIAETIRYLSNHPPLQRDIAKNGGVPSGYDNVNISSM